MWHFDNILWVLCDAEAYCVLCIMYCVLCIVYCVLCVVLYIVYCVLCIVYCVLCIAYCVLCIVYCVCGVCVGGGVNVYEQEKNFFNRGCIINSFLIMNLGSGCVCRRVCVVWDGDVFKI